MDTDRDVFLNALIEILRSTGHGTNGVWSIANDTIIWKVPGLGNAVLFSPAGHACIYYSMSSHWGQRDGSAKLDDPDFHEVFHGDADRCFGFDCVE